MLRASSTRLLKRPYSAALHIHATNGPPLDVHPEVQEALASKRPIVALETTLIAHGLPWPTNLSVGKELEDIVRETGSVPATVGIIGGRVKIGMDASQLEYLASASQDPKRKVAKISRRDIAPAIANKADGGTTCSSTLIFAALAGIKVFATGGLGGVHRGGENTMDISADLQELTRCPVGLVSAGVKSILDIGRTLEYLETLGVPVLPYGTNEFPAFFTRHSGHKLPWNVEDAAMAAKVLYTQKQMNMSMGAIFAVPIPEAYEAAGASIQRAVDQAVRESEANGVSKMGKEATPWLLKRVGELTEGRSIESNIALLRNTAFVGGNIAVEYARLLADPSRYHAPVSVTPNISHEKQSQPAENAKPTPKAKTIVAGSAAVDITAQVASDQHGSRSTSPGTVSISLGGVGRNIAEAAHRTSPSDVLLVSAVGEDSFGRLLSDETARLDMRTDGLVNVSGERTAVCNMFLNSSGELINGVAAMDIIEQLSADQVTRFIREHLSNLVCLDGNLSPETIQKVIQYSHKTEGTHILFEPTSVTKSTRILPALASSLHAIDNARSCVSFITPNLLELEHIYQSCASSVYELTSTPEWWKTIDDFSLGSEMRNNLEILARLPVCDSTRAKGSLDFLVNEGVAQMAINLLPFFQHLLIKCGAAGAILVMRVPQKDSPSSSWTNQVTNMRQRQIVSTSPSGEVIVIQHFPPLSIHKDDIVNVTGAGDSFVGVILAGLARMGPRAFQTPELASELVQQGQKAAVLTLKSERSVSPLIGAAKW